MTRLGWLKEPPDLRDRAFAVSARVAAAALPTHADVRPAMPRVYDQGQLGSCTANAANACVQHAETAAGDPDHDRLSRLWTYYWSRELEGTETDDSGAYIRDAFKVAATRGVPREKFWPYNVDRFAERPPDSLKAAALEHQAISYHRIDTTRASEASMAGCLAEGFPFAFGFDVPASFEDIGANGYWTPQVGEPSIGGHAVVAVGYDFRPDAWNGAAGGHWIVRNSWSAGWGLAGHFLVPRAWLPRNADDLWTVRAVSLDAPKA